MSKDFNLMNIEDITKLGTVTENSNERYTYNGISVPRVTSIISKMIQEDSIIYWANSLGFKHMGYRKTLNQYADYGTKVHKAIELFLKNQTITFKVPDNPFNAFTYWWETINESNEVTILGQEHKMACKYYGGTYDLLLKIGNDIVLVDFKTSNHVGYKYWLQLAAYTKILKEEENVNVEAETEDSDFDGSDFYEEINDEVIEPEVIEPEVIEHVTVNPVVDTVGNVTTTRSKGLYLSPEVREAIAKRFTVKFNEEMKKAVEYDVREEIFNIISAFCDNKDVFVVNMPFVTIRNTGQIIGYHGNRRLIADRDSDVRIDYQKYELTKYGYMSDLEFTTIVEKFLSNLLSGNYVFINRKYCGFDTAVTGELVLKIAVASRKKYLFKK